MVLLCVKVKKGKFNGVADYSKTYVIIKVQNLKSGTIARPGNEPCWEQDYIFDINDLQCGLLVEVWKSGWLWDSVLGSVWIPLKTILHATDEGSGEWWTLYSEIITKGKEICCIKSPTLHEILLDLYFAMPLDGVIENQDANHETDCNWTSSNNAEVSLSSQKYLLSTIKKESWKGFSQMGWCDHALRSKQRKLMRAYYRRTADNCSTIPDGGHRTRK
ncbi:protein unc-13 homolog A-like [Ascaphus truei]|uniref:protein unc-13 homolog A-like n=1 Tax=Ascaphus truei TaxID=8439 RepID=UPI003F5A2EA6